MRLRPASRGALTFAAVLLLAVLGVAIRHGSERAPPSGAFQERAGLVLPPRAEESFRLLGAAGRLPVRVTAETRFGVRCADCLDLAARIVHTAYTPYAIPALADSGRSWPLREDAWIRVNLADADPLRHWSTWLRLGRLPPVGRIRVGDGQARMPTEDRPWLEARLASVSDGGVGDLVARVGDRDLPVELASEVVIWGVGGPDDLVPYATEVWVEGRAGMGGVDAERIAIRPVGDPVAHEDAELPRLLSIGDSISIGYLDALRRRLEGRINVHHPPTNCGPSERGVEWLDAWLGPYEEAGRGWDVVTFNFGHWDSVLTKGEYQANLERIVTTLEATGAELIFLTTTPVDRGFPDAAPPTAPMDPRSRAPGRLHGTMRNYLNPWALEVMEAHPNIRIVDLWAVVAEDEAGVFRGWWTDGDVHFYEEAQNDALARAIAAEVVAALREAS